MKGVLFAFTEGGREGSLVRRRHTRRPFHLLCDARNEMKKCDADVYDSIRSCEKGGSLATAEYATHSIARLGGTI